MSNWPTQVLATGVLVWNRSDQLLMVRTHNRETLILPGGLVEPWESPAAAGRREVLEEVGLHITVGRLLVVQHIRPEGVRPSSVQFVFNSEPVDATEPLRLQGDEISAAHWMDPDDAIDGQSGPAGQRLRAALNAYRGGPVLFLESD